MQLSLLAAQSLPVVSYVLYFMSESSVFDFCCGHLIYFFIEVIALSTTVTRTDRTQRRLLLKSKVDFALSPLWSLVSDVWSKRNH